MKYDGMKSERIIRCGKKRAKIYFHYTVVVVVHFAMWKRNQLKTLMSIGMAKWQKFQKKRTHICDGETKNCVDGIAR